MTKLGFAVALCSATGCLTAGQDNDPYGFGEGTDPTAVSSAGSSSESGDEGTAGATSGATGPATSPVGEESGSSSSTGEATPVCGNDMLEGTEMCDGTDVGDLTCTGLGFTHGEILCNTNCLGYSTENCHNCGDGMLDGPETCDGGVPPGATCMTAGETAGTVTCDETICMLDASQCSLCGDGMVEFDESCDSGELEGATCESIGFGGGDLACSDEDCNYDVSGCDGGSFLEDWETNAFSADWSFSGNANWTIVGAAPIAGSFTARSGAITTSQQTGMLIDLTFPAGGTISFMHRESSEGGFDYLRFFIDNVEQQSWAGENGAAMASYDVAAGAHTFEWRYTKDGSVDAGSDAVWVDDITAEGGGPV